MKNKIFNLPILGKRSDPSLGAIRPGIFVKVSNKYDRFWVEVREVDMSTGYVTGRVDNEIDRDIGYGFDDILRFHVSAVTDIYTPHR